jgi:GTPase
MVGAVVQRVDAPNAHTFIGKGKVEELRELVAEREADLVIFDEDLKPDQAKNLERELDVRVMDRSELILDIFASRARTREAGMQVELAQLEYLLPRLQRMWTHLSRIRGGIGLRGPGETQLETDRRLIGKRIADLKRKLVKVARARETQRQRRVGEYRVALVGYTNAGKSSILRALSGADVLVEDRLFATLDSATRQVEVGQGYQALLTDTVGFIRKLPTTWWPPSAPPWRRPGRRISWCTSSMPPTPSGRSRWRWWTRCWTNWSSTRSPASSSSTRWTASPTRRRRP